MSISPETLLFMEARAICLMSEKGRAEFLEPTPTLANAIAEKLAPYADAIVGYGKPPSMQAAWDKISEDTGSRTGQINMDMMDIAKIYDAATAHLSQPSTKLLESIQSARIMLRTQAFPPRLRILGEAAALAVSQPDFKKGGFAPTV